jgi:hypothetical protein
MKETFSTILRDLDTLKKDLKDTLKNDGIKEIEQYLAIPRLQKCLNTEINVLYEIYNRGRDNRERDSYSAEDKYIFEHFVQSRKIDLFQPCPCYTEKYLLIEKIFDDILKDIDTSIFTGINYINFHYAIMIILYNNSNFDELYKLFNKFLENVYNKINCQYNSLNSLKNIISNILIILSSFFVSKWKNSLSKLQIISLFHLIIDGHHQDHNKKNINTLIRHIDFEDLIVLLVMVRIKETSPRIPNYITNDTNDINSNTNNNNIVPFIKRYLVRVIMITGSQSKKSSSSLKMLPTDILRSLFDKYLQNDFQNSLDKE